MRITFRSPLFHSTRQVEGCNPKSIKKGEIVGKDYNSDADMLPHALMDGGKIRVDSGVGLIGEISLSV